MFGYFGDASAPLPAALVVEETDACFIVRDANGQALAFVYFEEEPGRRSAAHLLTRDEARGSPPTSPSCRSCPRGAAKDHALHGRARTGNSRHRAQHSRSG